MSTSNFYFACVPHVPLQNLQAKAQNAEAWAAYDARVAELDAFDPELIVVFGSDHYSSLYLKLAPTFLIGHIAEATSADRGGTGGKLDVPRPLSTRLHAALTDNGFDLAASYAMTVDHGFSNVLGHFLHGNLSARPVIPIFISSLWAPRATMKRCRELGEAVGRWARGLGKRVAFLGSGGLSHSTDFLFPQYDTAPDEAMRTFIVHGAAGGTISDEKWHGELGTSIDKLSRDLVSGKFVVPWINKKLDMDFLQLLVSSDLSQLDAWTDDYIIEHGGSGASEIRNWLAAAAAGRAAGAVHASLDYYSDKTTVAVGYGVAHGA